MRDTIPGYGRVASLATRKAELACSSDRRQEAKPPTFHTQRQLPDQTTAAARRSRRSAAMGDHQDASSSGERNPSSPAAAMSGIDWSIFKDGEEDAFGWLLRNNNASASAAAAMSAGMMGGMAADILPLDDIEMDRMMAATSSQQATNGQQVGAATAAQGCQPLTAAQTNVRLMAAQLYEGLRPSPSKPPANLLAMLPGMPSFGNGVGGSYDKFDDDDAWEDELEEKEAQEQSEAKAAPSESEKSGPKQGSGAASSQAIEEKAPARTRSTRGRPKQIPLLRQRASDL